LIDVVVEVYFLEVLEGISLDISINAFGSLPNVSVNALSNFFQEIISLLLACQFL